MNGDVKDLNGDMPAFPVVASDFGQRSANGLSKRELIAALCMAGYNANTAFSDDIHMKTATLAVADADALLAALAKREEK